MPGTVLERTVGDSSVFQFQGTFQHTTLISCERWTLPVKTRDRAVPCAQRAEDGDPGSPARLHWLPLTVAPLQTGL